MSSKLNRFYFNLRTFHPALWCRVMPGLFLGAYLGVDVFIRTFHVHWGLGFLRSDRTSDEQSIILYRLEYIPESTTELLAKELGVLVAVVFLGIFIAYLMALLQKVLINARLDKLGRAAAADILDVQLDEGTSSALKTFMSYSPLYFVSAAVIVTDLFLPWYVSEISAYAFPMFLFFIHAPLLALNKKIRTSLAELSPIDHASTETIADE